MLHTRGDSRGWTSVTPTTTPTVGGSLFRQGRCQEPGTQLANGMIWVHMCGLHPKGVSMRASPKWWGCYRHCCWGTVHPVQIVGHFACLHAPRETGSEPQGAGTGLPLTRTSWFPCSCLWRPRQHVEQQSRRWSQLLERRGGSFPSHPYSYSVVTPPFTPPGACSWFCFPLGSVPTSFPTSLH